MNLIDSFVEVTLTKPEDFLKIKETLTRIGVASRRENKLFQSCHIFHKQGRYYVVHFKELFMLDGKPTDYTDEDKGRRNIIVSLLSEWGLVNIVNVHQVLNPVVPLSQIKVISHKDKSQWKLESKYNIGRKR